MEKYITKQQIYYNYYYCHEFHIHVEWSAYAAINIANKNKHAK